MQWYGAILALFFSLPFYAMEVEMNERSPLISPPPVMTMSEDDDADATLPQLPFDVQNVISQLSMDEAETKWLTLSFLRLLSPYRVLLSKPVQGSKIDLRDSYPCWRPHQFEIDVQGKHNIRFKSRMLKLLCIDHENNTCCPCCIYGVEEGYRRGYNTGSNRGVIQGYIVQEQSPRCCCSLQPPEGIFLLQQDSVHFHQFDSIIRYWCKSDVVCIDLCSLLCTPDDTCGGQVNRSDFALYNIPQSMSYSPDTKELFVQHENTISVTRLNDRSWPGYQFKPALRNVPQEVMYTHDIKNTHNNKIRVEQLLQKCTFRKLILLKQIAHAVETEIPLDLRDADDAKEFELVVPRDIRDALQRKKLLVTKSWYQKLWG